VIVLLDTRNSTNTVKQYLTSKASVFVHVLYPVLLFIYIYIYIQQSYNHVNKPVFIVLSLLYFLMILTECVLFVLIVRPEAVIRRQRVGSLNCVVTGFYPKDITVEWMVDGRPALDGISTGLLPNHDQTYQIQMTIVLSDATHNYSCQIKHSSLQELMFTNIPL